VLFCAAVKAQGGKKYWCSLALNVEVYVDVLIYLLSAVGLTPGGSSTVHIYTQTIHRKTQLNWEECWLCPVCATYTLTFFLQLREKRGKTSVRVAEECQLA